VLVAWLVGYHLLLRDFGPCGIIFMNVCVVISVDMVMLLRDFRPYGILFMVCVLFTCLYTRCRIGYLFGVLSR
jgi:hypothetical protein